MTFKEASRFGYNILQAAHIRTAVLDGQLILEYVSGKPKEFILTHPEFELNEAQSIKFKNLIKKRSQNTPVAYLTGSKWFYGLEFKVNRNVLIPRPETELIVDLAQDVLRSMLRNMLRNKVFAIDIGCGSGCIIISLQNSLKKAKKITFLASDVSRAALHIAKVNAQKYKKSIRFLHGNLLKPYLKSGIDFHDSNIVITANLPYLTPAQIENSPSIQSEPRLALAAGDDGLKYYRELFRQLKTFKKNTDANITCLCEIDPTQKRSISSLAKKELGVDAQIHPDLKGHSRAAIINL